MVQEKATDIPKCSDVSFSRLISQREKSPGPSLEKVPVTPNPRFWTKDVGGSYSSHSLEPIESKIRMRIVKFTWKSGDGVESF